MVRNLRITLTSEVHIRFYLQCLFVRMVRKVFLKCQFGPQTVERVYQVPNVAGVRLMDVGLRLGALSEMMVEKNNKGILGLAI